MSPVSLNCRKFVEQKFLPLKLQKEASQSATTERAKNLAFGLAVSWVSAFVRGSIWVKFVGLCFPILTSSDVWFSFWFFMLPYALAFAAELFFGLSFKAF